MRISILIFDLLLIYILFGQMFLRRFYPLATRRKALLRDIEKHFRHLLRRNRDLYKPELAASLTSAIADVHQTRKQGNAEQVAACLEKYQDGTVVPLPARSLAWVKEYLEIFIVALALAFGVRGLFLQPFKIPTGSMQPTLFGIHFEPLHEPVKLNPVQRFFDYLHYSRRYVDVSIERGGYLEYLRPATPKIPFFPATIIRIGGVNYRLPGDVEQVAKYCLSAKSERLRTTADVTKGMFFEEGEVLARGRLQLGDHLFVNRTRFSYTEPQRGDITVFLTDGIRDGNNDELAGRYYIKRLVGLPGDQIRIKGRELYVKPAGEHQFQRLDGSTKQAFDRLYSHRGGYRGYCHDPRAQYLTSDEHLYVVGKDQYFMLGDNSENSRDSRFWGTVPRENLVGRACLIWWPFSRRWGIADRAEPLDVASPPGGGRYTGAPE